MHLLHHLSAAMSIESVEVWLSAGGYFLLFGLLVACGMGLPLPEDIPIMAAGALAANHQMHLAVAGLVAWLGILAGDTVLYHLGLKFGLEIVRVPFIGKHVTRERIEKAEHLFDRYGVWVIAVGRMVAGVRGAVVVAAGATRFNFIKFIIADALAAIVSGGLFLLLGFWLGSRLREHMAQIHHYKEYVLAGVLLAILFTILIVLLRSPRAHQDESGR